MSQCERQEGMETKCADIHAELDMNIGVTTLRYAATPVKLQTTCVSEKRFRLNLNSTSAVGVDPSLSSRLIIGSDVFKFGSDLLVDAIAFIVSRLKKERYVIASSRVS